MTDVVTIVSTTLLTLNTGQEPAVMTGSDVNATSNLDIDHYSPPSNDVYANPYADEYVVNLVFLIMTVVMMVVGCVGNVLVIAAVLTHRKLRNLGNAFVVNLAVADLCVSAFINAFGIAGLVTVGAFFDDQAVLCQVVGVICITSCSCSLWNIACIGVNRYVAIVHRTVYHSIYNKRTLPALLVGIWGICFIIDIPNLTGWGSHDFDPKLMLCTYNYTTSYSYTFFFIVTGFGIPLAALSYSYTRIFLYARASTKEINAINKAEKPQTTTTKQVIRKSDLRLLKSVFTIVVVFLIMWSPYAVVVIFDRHATWSRNLYVVVLMMAHMNSCINSILYGATNRNFRQAYADILCSTLTCGLRKKIRQVTQSSDSSGTANSNI